MIILFLNFNYLLCIPLKELTTQFEFRSSIANLDMLLLLVVVCNGYMNDHVKEVREVTRQVAISIDFSYMPSLL